jgi:hypothetical protein
MQFAICFRSTTGGDSDSLDLKASRHACHRTGTRDGEWDGPSPRIDQSTLGNWSKRTAMNKTYRSIWNESLGAWVATSENTAARGKRSKSAISQAVALAVLLGGVGLNVAHAQYQAWRRDGNGYRSHCDRHRSQRRCSVRGDFDGHWFGCHRLQPDWPGRLSCNRYDSTGNRCRFDRDRQSDDRERHELDCNRQQRNDREPNRRHGLGRQQQRVGHGATAIGTNASSNVANSVALGNSSITTAASALGSEAVPGASIGCTDVVPVQSAWRSGATTGRALAMLPGHRHQRECSFSGRSGGHASPTSTRPVARSQRSRLGDDRLGTRQRLGMTGLGRALAIGIASVHWFARQRYDQRGRRPGTFGERHHQPVDLHVERPEHGNQQHQEPLEFDLDRPEHCDQPAEIGSVATSASTAPELRPWLSAATGLSTTNSTISRLSTGLSTSASGISSLSTSTSTA